MSSRKNLLPLIGIAFSLVILVIVASLFNFNLSMILSINPIYFLLATISSVAVLLLQGLRFKFIIEKFTSKGPYSLSESLAVRIGSQFVAMTTPAYVGGEVARAAWLTTKGIAPGTALWLPYIEIIFDVYSTGIFSLLSGILALSEGLSFLGSILSLLSSLMLALMTLVIFVSRSGKIRIPAFISRLATRILGERRGSQVVEKADSALLELKEAANTTLNRKNTIKLFYLSIYTILLALLTGSTLYFIAAGLSINLGFFQSLLVVFASVILGNLPITFGGAGLAEAGVYYYCSLAFGISSWPMVFAWRMASYIIPLIISGLSGSYVLHRFVNQKSN
ncbi:MAG: lysylphosphatidylglycerol synthase transmembrane domain-containing protein [Conexivisphaerales archaeon]